MSEERLVRVIEDFNYRNLNLFFRSKCENYAEAPEDLPQYDDERFTDFQKLGEIRFDGGDKLVITSSLVSSDLSERSGKKAQYEKAKKILKEMVVYDTGFFIFHDNTGSFRFSLVYAQFQGTKRSFSNFRRFTYLVSRNQTSKTFRKRVGECDFSSLDAVKDAFSVEKVNKEFYNHIARFFYRLTGYQCKREMTLPSASDDDKETYQEFAVRLIGRAIFCWFLKHKKSANSVPLIPESILSSEAVRQNSQYYHSTLEKLFFEILNTPQEQRHNNILRDAAKIPFLNGGLFEPRDDFYDNGEPQYNLVIPDVWFEQFLEILEQYNFTIDENSTIDADVSVDPEMLGRIFENLLAEVNPETGETARKATGSYYTPRTIVDYMVDQSLGQYLITKTKIEEDIVTALLSYESPEVVLSESEKGSIISALDEMKIIDPACGSGAFPMGILHKMLLVLQKADPDLKLWLKNHLANIEPGMFRDMLMERIRNENWEYVRKLLIIQASIYGVDIQTIAVEICKLRFFLSLIVDEQIDDLKKNRGVEALPNLEFKFVAANSLTGLPPVINRQVGLGVVSDEINRLKELRHKYLRSYGSEKTQIEEDFLKTSSKLIEQNIKWGGKDTLALQLGNWNPFSNQACDWFDPDWMFGVEDGFDIVIANPPYVRKENLKPSAITTLGDNFFEIENGQKKSWTDDLYVHFVFKGFGLARPLGVISYICNDSFIGLSSKQRVRELMLSNCLLKVIRCPKGTFEAMIYTAVFIAQSTQGCEQYESGHFEYPSYTYVLDGHVPYSIVHELPNKRFVTYSGSLSVLQKLQQKPRLKDYLNILDTGIHSGNVRDKIFYKTEVKNNLFRLLQGRQIGPYMIAWDSPEAKYKYCDITYVPQSTLGVGRKGKPSKHPEYWHFCGNIDNHHKPERLLMRQTDDDLIVAYHNEERMGRYYTDNTLFTILPKNENPISLKYALALLNSKLLNHIYQFLSQEEGKTLAQVKVKLVNELPFVINYEYEKPIIEKVDAILSLTASVDYSGNAQKMRQVEDIKEQIDQTVFRIYSLTEDEIKLTRLIDSGFGKEAV